MAVIVIAMVAAWAAVEAVLAIENAARPIRGKRRFSLFGGLIDWRA